MQERKSCIEWFKEHKKELIFVGVAVTGGILVTKNWNTIKKIFVFVEPNKVELPKAELVMETVPTLRISNDILDNLTGNKLTARELGNKVGHSAQTINKRIVSAGLAERLPYGEYMMTETGRLLGEDTWKVTAAGHSFSNIEWDEKILEIICEPEELLKLAVKQNEGNQAVA